MTSYSPVRSSKIVEIFDFNSFTKFDSDEQRQVTFYGQRITLENGDWGDWYSETMEDMRIHKLKDLLHYQLKTIRPETGNKIKVRFAWKWTGIDNNVLAYQKRVQYLSSSAGDASRLAMDFVARDAEFNGDFEFNKEKFDKIATDIYSWRRQIFDNETWSIDQIVPHPSTEADMYDPDLIRSRNEEVVEDSVVISETAKIQAMDVAANEIKRKIDEETTEKIVEKAVGKEEDFLTAAENIQKQKDRHREALEKVEPYLSDWRKTKLRGEDFQQWKPLKKSGYTFLLTVTVKGDTYIFTGEKEEKMSILEDVTVEKIDEALMYLENTYQSESSDSKRTEVVKKTDNEVVSEIKQQIRDGEYKAPDRVEGAFDPIVPNAVPINKAGETIVLGANTNIKVKGNRKEFNEIIDKLQPKLYGKIFPPENIEKEFNEKVAKRMEEIKTPPKKEDGSIDLVALAAGIEGVQIASVPHKDSDEIEQILKAQEEKTGAHEGMVLVNAEVAREDADEVIAVDKVEVEPESEEEAQIPVNQTEPVESGERKRGPRKKKPKPPEEVFEAPDGFNFDD